MADDGSTRSAREVVVDVWMPRTIWAKPAFVISFSVGGTALMVGPLLWAVFSNANAWVIGAVVWCVVVLLVMMGTAALSFHFAYAAMARLQRSVGARLEEHEHIELEDLLCDLEWSKTDSRFVGRFTARLGAQLMRAGYRNRAIRVWYDQEGHGPVPQPLHVPFEPIQLREGSSAFGGLESAASNHFDDRAVVRSRPAHFWASSRGRRLVGIGSAVVILLALTIFIVTLKFQALMPICFVLPGFFPLIFRGPRASLWAFPGGIAVPSARKNENWRFFRRENGLLVTVPGAILVFDPEFKLPASQAATDREAELAMRAWLATVPPPTDEQLEAAFAG